MMKLAIYWDKVTSILFTQTMTKLSIKIYKAINKTLKITKHNKSQIHKDNNNNNKQNLITNFYNPIYNKI